MKIVIPGGTGQIGTLLAREFTKQGHNVTVLSRTARKLPWRVVLWDAEHVDSWAAEFEGADVVINLAGRSVDCRYSPENRRLILESRVMSTRAVGLAIAAANNPPAVWLQMGTATIYAHRYDAPNDELTGIIGGAEDAAPDTWRFSIEVAKAWETELEDAVVPKTRKVLLRTAMTMSPDRGGVFDTLLGLTRRGLGGTSGDGHQYVSWIHELDFIRAILWLVEHPSFSGPVNLASPNPLPNREFMALLRAAARIPFGLSAPEWMLEIGAFFMATETELILKSRRVVPARLLESGFSFKFPDWKEASLELFQRRKKLTQNGSSRSL